nr:TA system VapC family ribonuclease toxin [Serinicoccus marinus]
MLALDVNVLVGALHRGSPGHTTLRPWLERAVDGEEVVGISDAVLTGTLRVVTHPRVFTTPATVPEAAASISNLLRHPNVRTLRTLAGHWQLVLDLCERAGATGNLVADAAHAATAMQHGATLISDDADFARFPGVAWRRPLDPRP